MFHCWPFVHQAFDQYCLIINGVVTLTNPITCFAPWKVSVWSRLISNGGLLLNPPLNWEICSSTDLHRFHSAEAFLTTAQPSGLTVFVWWEIFNPVDLYWSFQRRKTKLLWLSEPSNIWAEPNSYYTDFKDLWTRLDPLIAVTGQAVSPKEDLKEYSWFSAS